MGTDTPGIPIGGMAAGRSTTRPAQATRGTYLEVIHSWIVTVDHKKLGILYIGYALIFLVVAGIEALVIRMQLFFPHNAFVGPATFNRHVHHARHHHGVPGGHADSVSDSETILCR